MPLYQMFRGGGNPLSVVFSDFSSYKFLFWLFLLVYIFIGFYLVFDNNLVTKFFDIYFDMDVNKYYRIVDNPDVTSGFICKHPLYSFFVYPLIQLLKGIIHDKRLVIIIFQALVSSWSNCLIFGMFNKLSKDVKLSLLLTFIYGFGFSTVIFTGFFESFIFSTFFMLIFLYYSIYLIDNKVTKLSWKNIFVIVVTGIGTYGIVLSNIASYIIGLIFLVRKIYGKNIKVLLFNIFKILICFVAVSGIFMLLSKLCMPRTSYLFEYPITKGIKAFEGRFFSYADLLIQDFIAPFTAIGWTINPLLSSKLPKIILDCTRFQFVIPTLIFYITSMVTFVINIKKLKYKSLCTMFILILTVHFLYSLDFNSKYAFLFAQNFFYSIVLLLGIVHLSVPERFKKLLYFSLTIFLSYQLFANFYITVQMHKYVLLFDAIPKFNCFVMLVYSLLITSLIYFVYFFLKKIISKKLLESSVDKKIFVALSSYVFFIIISFIFYGICWWRL